MFDQDVGSEEAQELTAFEDPFVSPPNVEAEGWSTTQPFRELDGMSFSNEELAWTEQELNIAGESHESSPPSDFLHRCRPGEGPPQALPDPEGKGPHPSVRRWGGSASRGPTVGYAQQLLNRFLGETATGFHGCVDQSEARLTYMQGLRANLRKTGEDPLIVDCRFGPNTERAVKIFQACFGLVRDGKIGPVTWNYLRRYEGSPTIPPDTSTCGVPDRPSRELELALDEELTLLHQVPQTGGRVRSRLSLYQNHPLTSHRNHFHCQASRVARRIGAYAEPRADACTPRRVGPTAYNSGADIINAIASANSCLNQRIGAVHIFGHSGSYGVFGVTAGSAGLYRDSVDAALRATGARQISDVPSAALADDVVVVLHGCNQASGADSFAERLYRHLRGTLRQPTVFAHHNPGCAGRDNSWRVYSNRFPSGQNVRSIAPHYLGNGCCSPSRSEFPEPVEIMYSEETGRDAPCPCGGHNAAFASADL